MNYKNWLNDEVAKLLSANALSDILTETPVDNTVEFAPKEKVSENNENDEIAKELCFLWDFVNQNRVALQNCDFTNQNFQQELETCANKNHVNK